MRLIKILFSLTFIFSSCNKTTTGNNPTEIKSIQNSIVDKSQLELIPEKGRWFYKNKPFNGFAVVSHPNNKIAEVKELQKEVAAFTDMVKWKFVASSRLEIDALYDSFKTDEPLDNSQSTKAFIIDKEVNLRGRTDDEDFIDGILFGYDMNSVAILKDKMKDDVKVLLAEYRLALKKNDADRQI